MSGDLRDAGAAMKAAVRDRYGGAEVVRVTEIDPTVPGDGKVLVRGERYDWILDADSHQSIVSSRRALRPGGRYVTLGFGGLDILQGLVVGPLLGLFGSRRAGMMLWWKPFNAADIATLTDLVLSGHVTPAIDRRYPLSETADALRWVDEGRAKGKVVIIVTSAGDAR
jgi:NADPH:quinone reductase-like Zn-dependent oxidoreductase